MNQPDSSLWEKEVVNRLKFSNQAAFLALYDQYASVLLGVITKMVGDQQEAVTLLEKTFIEVRSQVNQFQPEKQPAFVWLLRIARGTAIEALQKRNSARTTLQLTASDQVIVATSQKNNRDALTDTPPDLANSQLNEILRAVLFKNCTPEEAATSLGLPAELARQQLRLALQQLGDSRRS